MNENIFLLKIVHYYFDDIIKFEDLDLDNSLIEEKSYENVSVNDISYKTLVGAKA